jgi:hypothetical protein
MDIGVEGYLIKKRDVMPALFIHHRLKLNAFVFRDIGVWFVPEITTIYVELFI